MAIDSVLSTAVGGIQSAARKADTSASEILRASANATPAATSDGGVISPQPAAAETAFAAQSASSREGDLLSGVVGLIEAEIAYKANAEVIKTAEELSDELVDITS